MSTSSCSSSNSISSNNNHTTTSLDTAAILKNTLLNLDKERQKIHEEIQFHLNILGPVGMNQPLIDGK